MPESGSVVLVRSLHDWRAPPVVSITVTLAQASQPRASETGLRMVQSTGRAPDGRAHHPDVHAIPHARTRPRLTAYWWVAAVATVLCALAAALISGRVVAAYACFAVAGVLVGYVVAQRSRARLDGARWFELSNDMLVEASLDGYFTRLSDRWEQAMGWTLDELMARPMVDFVHPDDVAATKAVASALDERPGEVANFESRYRTKDGEWRWLLWSARSDAHRKYAVARDITERKALEAERTDLLAQVEALARTDALTGLPNRRRWDEELDLAAAASLHLGRQLALAMIDLDHFKVFNDTYGHARGDELLSEAAKAWSRTLRSTDFLSRYGGEEFAALLPDCGPVEAAGLLERLRAATPQGQTCSVGFAYLEEGESPQSLIERADAALYEAKRAGRDRVTAAR